MEFTEISYELPAHWASALINGDRTGLDDKEERDLDRFLRGEELADWDVTIHEELCEPYFEPHHDARVYGVLACDCLGFVFFKPERIQS